MTNPVPAGTAQAPTPKRHGCFFYGCITCLVLLLLVFIGGCLAVRWGVHRVNQLVADYTDTSAAPIQKVDISDADLKQLKTRVAAFQSALDAHSNAPPLVLSSRDINALIENDPNVKNFHGQIHVELESNQIKGEISVPLDGLVKMPMIDVKGRYLNGGGTFQAAITNGLLFLSIESLEVKGKPLPGDVMAALQKQNLAQGFNQSSNANVFERYESVEVKDSNLIVTPKSP